MNKNCYGLLFLIFMAHAHGNTEHNNFEQYVFSGNEHFRNNQLDEAIAAYDSALTLKPDCAPIQFNRGLVLTAQNNIAAALTAFKQVIILAPNHTKAHMNAARLYQQLNQNYYALAHFKQVTNYDPHSCEAYLESSKIYQDLELYDQALEQLIQAVACKPEATSMKIAIGNCLLNTGNAFFNRRQSAKALQAFRAALELSDRFAAMYHNIGFTLAEQLGQYHEALHEYEKALAIKPKDEETHFCYALALLATGDLTRGFKEYEARWRRPASVNAAFTYPYERQLTNIYEQEVYNKRVLLRVEQGLGDTLQFIRYAKLLKERGAIVIAEIQKPLIPLLSHSSYIDHIIPFGSKRPPFDLQIPMLNFPLAFNTTLETIPALIPYISADKTLIDHWHEKLAQDNTFKIGICWYGDAVHGQGKFMPLSYFTRLAHLPGITLYSMQKGSGQDQLTGDMPIKKLGDDFDESHGSFMDTAAVMENLDLVITVDTSVAHLAGALGVPVWVVLPFPAEWRWLMNRDDSPWYPTMRLFRQVGPENWDNVLAELIDALIPLLER